MNSYTIKHLQRLVAQYSNKDMFLEQLVTSPHIRKECHMNYKQHIRIHTSRPWEQDVSLTQQTSFYPPSSISFSSLYHIHRLQAGLGNILTQNANAPQK